MKNFFLLLLTVGLTVSAYAQEVPDGPLVHTYSIVAFDENTGQIGVAVQSHWFAVGNVVTWGEAGLGVIATQSFANPSFGPDGLDLLRKGYSPQQVVDTLTARDPGRDFRQLAVLDASGRVAVFTGEKCIEAAGHLKGDGYSVQANLMRNEKVWPAMARAFEVNTDLPLAERLLEVLKAAESAGGDIRGKQSAAIQVYEKEPTGNIWQDRSVNLHVEDHPDPLAEIGRLLRIHRAYEYMNKGDVAVEEGDMERALDLYDKSMSLFPENQEMKFWTAVSLANNGEREKALELFEAIFSENMDWHELIGRLKGTVILQVDEELYQDIINIGN